MEQIFVYRTSGGKNILSNLSNEVKPIVLTVLEGILKDGLENFTTRPIDKKITPTLYEIKKKDVRIFYYRGLDNTINIVYITEHKQKNKTESAYSQRTYIENTTGALVPERIDLSGRSPKSVYIVSKKYNL